MDAIRPEGYGRVHPTAVRAGTNRSFVASALFFSASHGSALLGIGFESEALDPPSVPPSGASLREVAPEVHLPLG
jgi:hypothetical protein